MVKDQQKAQETAKKPTKLLKKPEKVGCLSFFTTDTGTYTTAELSKVSGLSASTIYQRIRYYGWDHHLIFVPRARPGYRIDGRPVIYPGLCNAIKNNDQGSLHYLGGKSRSKNLERFPPPGTLEQKYLQAAGKRG